MEIDVVLAPYDSAHREKRLGLGPYHLTRSGLLRHLQTGGHDVRTFETDVGSAFPTDVGVAFELARVIGAHVKDSVRRGRFPIVLAGNCSSCLGTVAGLGATDVAVVWFDAHGDFNTPETTGSGFLDGMSLALLTGRCWTTMSKSVPGLAPIPEPRVVLVGARDLDPEEMELLAASRIALLPPDILRRQGLEQAAGPVIDRLGEIARSVYVHVDLDVLDPGEGRANEYAAPDGLALAELLSLVDLIGQRLTIRAAAITAYDPAFDEDGDIYRAAIEIVDAIIRNAERRTSAA